MSTGRSTATRGEGGLGRGEGRKPQITEENSGGQRRIQGYAKNKQNTQSKGTN